MTTPEPTPEQIAECESVIRGLEAVRPVILAIADRAANAFSAIEMAMLGGYGHLTQEEYDALPARVTNSRLFDLVSEINEATGSDAMFTSELKDAYIVEGWLRPSTT
jgi:hypothetical protein